MNASVFTLAPLCALLACAGCWTSGAPEAKSWMVAPRTDLPRPSLLAEGVSPAFAATRLGAVTVCAPYDRAQFVVHRADGSVAVDHYNVFAATPSALLRQPVKSRLEADGRFGHVVSQTSVVSADAQVEVLVKELSIDCREADRRTARAAVTVDVVKTGRGGKRTVTLAGAGTGTADAGTGDYTTAFSTAFDAALAEALKSMKEEKRK